MAFTVSDEAIETLNSTAGQLIESKNTIQNHVQKLSDVFAENQNGLGAHSEEIKSLLESMKAITKDANKSAAQLAMKAKSAAATRKSHRENNVYAGIGGAAAGAGVGAAIGGIAAGGSKGGATGGSSKSKDNDSSSIPRQLTQKQKDEIKKESSWSDSIVNNIRSIDEYKIYRDAGLYESSVGGKPALLRRDISWDKQDEKGHSNEERIAKGRAPIGKDGSPIELHHIGQHKDSPLAELEWKEHRGQGNDAILHDKNIESEAHGEGNTWDRERKDYWKSRNVM